MESSPVFAICVWNIRLNFRTSGSFEPQLGHVSAFCSNNFYLLHLFSLSRYEALLPQDDRRETSTTILQSTILIAKSSDMSTRFPRFRMQKFPPINSHNISSLLDKGFPPQTFRLLFFNSTPYGP